MLSGAVQQSNLVVFKFKRIRGLDTQQLTELLGKLADGNLPFAELKKKATELKNVAVLKTEFVKKVGCQSWKEAAERFHW